MKNLKPWVEAFNISPKDYENWQQQAPSSSVTYWCLEKGKISESDYLQWAREHYGLAVLKSNFFQEPANYDFWNLIKSVANWSSELLPLAEWDGVVFVACVEPPEQVNWSFPVRYLLASPENLHSYWNTLQSPPANATEPESKIQNPVEELKLSVKPKTSQKPKASSEPVVSAPPITPVEPMAQAESKIQAEPCDELEGLNLNLPSETPSPTEDSEMPDGLNLNLTPNKTGNEFQGLEGLDLNLPPEESSQSSGDSSMKFTLEGLAPEYSDTQTQSADSTSSMVIIGGTESLTPSESSDHSPHHLDAVSESTQKDKESDTQSPTSSGKDKNFKAFMEDSVVMQIPTEQTQTGSVNAAPSLPSPDGSSIDVKRIAPADINDANSENEALAWAFKRLKEHFKESMVLLYDGDNLRPWKWEKSWAPRSETAFEAFSLNDPSIFRIVRRTKLPYHGHVAPSDANREFFLNWGRANLPAHATVIPMRSGDTVIGLMLCTGEATANTSQVLMFADRIVTRLINGLSELDSKAA